MNVKPWSTVGPGASDVVVTGIQYLLRARGHAVATTGAYDPATVVAVKAFQASAALAADGVVGPLTWAALVVTTQAGSTGDAVRAVQQFGLVSSPGLPPLVVDGNYGPLTTERVTELQRQWGLTMDGQTGPETWSFLSTFRPGPRPWGLVKQGARQADNWRVLAAQYLLRAHGATIVADGIFGPASGTAVQAYQHTLRATEISTTLGQLDWPHLIITVRRGRPRRCGARPADASAERADRRRRLRTADRDRGAQFPADVRAAGRRHRRPGNLARADGAHLRLTQAAPRRRNRRRGAGRALTAPRMARTR